MVFRLVVVCAVELAIALLLISAMSTTSNAGTGAASAPPAATAARKGAPSPGGGDDAHMTAAPSSKAAQPAPAPAPEDAARERAATAGSGRTVAAAKMRPDDPVGVLLMGTVRWRDGGPVAEPSLYATCGKVSRSASEGKDGSFALAGLQPGEWTIRVSADGGVPGEETVTIGDDAMQQRDFVLDRSFPVRVLIVTPDGKDATTAAWQILHAMQPFHVVGQRDRFPDRLAPTDYGAALVGDARMDAQMNPEDGFVGTLAFAQRPPAYAALLLRHIVLEQQLVQPDQQEVRFVVDLEALKARLGSATVRVVDGASGAPLTGARVSLAGAGGMGTPVDAEGRATVENLLPGLLKCWIAAKDYESMESVISIEPGQRVELGEVRLGAQQNLKGRVLDADGKPAAASLYWTALKWRSGPTAFVSNRTTRAEADGTFTLWQTGPGAIAVTARAQDGRLAVGVFDNPPAAPVELRLEPPAECTVTRPVDLTRAFTVTLYDAQRRAVAAQTFEPRVLKSKMSMPAGDYAFEVHDDRGRLVQHGTLTFGANPTTLEIR
jgi:hypothetical protein